MYSEFHTYPFNSRHQFWVPLSSTHQFNTRTRPFQYPEFLSSTHSSVQHTPHQFNTKRPYLFNTKKRQFNTSLSSTHPSVQHTPQLNKSLSFKLRSVLNWAVCWTEGCGELRDLLNWRFFGIEKEWPFCVELMCWTEGARIQ